MFNLNPEEMTKLADAVVERLMQGHSPGHYNGSAARPETPFSPRTASAGSTAAVAWRKDVSVCTTTSSSVTYASLDEAADAAHRAQPHWVAVPMEKRKEIIRKIRSALHAEVQALSQLAVDETGLGRVEDKLSKNRLVIDKTPGPEYLEPQAFTGDDGLALIEYAPYGVIGSITPTTNPSETIINNGIAMLSAGNVVVFNPHPSAKRVSKRTMEIMNQVIVDNGGPSGCLTMPESPTIETAQGLMKHPKIRLLVVTGGPAVVKAAMASGKKVIAAGPGNPPVVVDETADLDQAAKGIVQGASLDNNIVCIAEKEIIAVDEIADELKRKLQKNGAYLLNSHQVRLLEKLVIDPESGGKYPSKRFVGKNASVILEAIGVQVGPEIRIAFCEVEESHPFVQTELLMPLIPLVRAPDVNSAIAMAKRVEHGNCHTAVMYSKNIDNLHFMAREMNTSIFVKNAPSYAGLGLGGEGYTSFTIASPTGEGLTTCRTFSRIRRCTLKDHFRIV